MELPFYGRLRVVGLAFAIAGLVGCSSSDEVQPTTSSTDTPAPQLGTPTTTVPTTTIEASQPIVRPYIDPTVCGAGAAKQTSFEDETWYPFGLAREAPIPVQVIAEPIDGVAQPFAVVLRLFHPDRDFTSGEIAVVNGAQVSIHMEANGNGQAAWKLPDGSVAYVRTRDLDKTNLAALISHLVPREPTAAIPGFDFQDDSGDTGGLRLLYEGTNTGLAGTISTFQCQTGDGQFIYRVQAIDGDPLVVYLGVMDAPRSYAVGTNGSGAITLYGIQDPAAPSLAQVVEADPAVWAALPVLA